MEHGYYTLPLEVHLDATMYTKVFKQILDEVRAIKPHGINMARMLVAGREVYFELTMPSQKKVTGMEEGEHEKLQEEALKQYDEERQKLHEEESKQFELVLGQAGQQECVGTYWPCYLGEIQRRPLTENRQRWSHKMIVTTQPESSMGSVF
jgi:hypothetical protein